MKFSGLTHRRARFAEQTRDVCSRETAAEDKRPAGGASRHLRIVALAPLIADDEGPRQPVAEPLPPP